MAPAAHRGDAARTMAGCYLALLLVTNLAWEAGRVAITATIFGVGEIVLLEWLNVELWRNWWTFAAAMPRLPPLGTGLTPVLQWLLLPTLCLLAARRLALAR